METMEALLKLGGQSSCKIPLPIHGATAMAAM